MGICFVYLSGNFLCTYYWVNTISVLREWNIRTELCDVLQGFVSGKVDVAIELALYHQLRFILREHYFDKVHITDVNYSSV
jgi:hypothetical protein